MPLLPCRDSRTGRAAQASQAAKNRVRDGPALASVLPPEVVAVVGQPVPPPSKQMQLAFQVWVVHVLLATRLREAVCTDDVC